MSTLATEPTLRPGLYRLPEDPIGDKVLVPGFRAAKSVRGAFGWFTAGWISQLAHGLAEYLNRNDTSPITFTVAPVIYPSEREALEAAQTMTPEDAAKRVAHVFIGGRLEADALGRHALDCLAWMLAVGRLCLRVAVPKPGSNYHPKLWLFDDGEHQVLVRGSANATGRGLDGAVEHMDVDITWSAHGQRRVAAGVAMLDDWQHGRSLGIERVVDLPDALKEGIVRTAPPSPPTVENYGWALREVAPPAIRGDASAKELEELRSRFGRRPAQEPPRLRIPDWLDWQTGAYQHQGEAVAAWESAGERGTLAMATGSGKTLTALVCAARAQERLDEAPLLVIVSAPSVPLIGQWREEIHHFGVEATTPTLSADTNRAITNLFRALGAGGTHIAVVTNHLLCDPAFQRTVSGMIGNAPAPVATMLIADEAHTLGAKSFITNRPTFLERRLALSATPERQHDPDGTEEIFEFFGPQVYEFGLNRAIGFCLTPYDYHVHATILAEDELDEFRELTKRIGQLLSRLRDKPEDDTSLKSLLIRRRRIIETAEAKIPLLRAVLSQRGPRSLKHALIYASAKNPEQFDGIAGTLTDLRIHWASVTQETTASPRILDERLKLFSDGNLQALLAKKVLDEGVDIPSTREAFIVASSTVEREWVQRRGRILRQYLGKTHAVLHDFLALPPVPLVRSADDSDTDLKRIVRGELSRAFTFAAHARNGVGSDGVLAHLEAIKNAYWPTTKQWAKPILQTSGDHLVDPSTPKGTPW